MIYNTQQSSHGVQDITDIGLEKKNQQVKISLYNGVNTATEERAWTGVISEFQNV